MQLNKVCNLEDWEDDERAETMRQLLPFFWERHPDFPHGMEHRKHWEFAQIASGLDHLGALGPDAMVLAVAAGQEQLLFALTERVRWVFATDVYGTGDFAAREADLVMLRDPDAVAARPYRRNRLVVQYMDALDLRFEAGTFQAAYSLSSIEHFGSLDAVRTALGEQRRVVAEGGVVAFTTEVIVNDAPPFAEGHLMLFRPEQLTELCQGLEGLALVEPIDFSVSDRTRAAAIGLADALADAQAGRERYPHVVLEHEGRLFTSVSVFLRVER